jgi:hypothetical protein
MAVVVRHHQPESVQYAVVDDTNERRGHDRLCRSSFVEAVYPHKSVTMLLSDTLDDV